MKENMYTAAFAAKFLREDEKNPQRCYRQACHHQNKNHDS
jgi:hypothetical protein